MTWSWKLTDEQRGGLTRQFVRYQLLRLNLGHDLTHALRGSGRYRIAPPHEVLKLEPELLSQPKLQSNRLVERCRKPTLLGSLVPKKVEY